MTVSDLGSSLELLLGAQGWASVADVLDAHPELLGTDARDALDHMLTSGGLNDIHAAWIDELRHDLADCAQSGSTASLRQRQGVHWATVWARFGPLVSQAYAAQNLFRTSHDVADLQRAEDLWRQIQDDVDMDSTPDGFQLLVLDGVAAVHLMRHSALGDPSDLEAGVAAAEQSASRTPPDGRLRGRRLTNLSGGLLTRARLRDDPADLRAGTDAAHEAVEVTDPDDPLWPGRINNMVAALITQAEHDPEVRGRALDILRTAIDRASGDPVTLPRLLHAQGSLHRQHYQEDGGVDALGQMIDAFASAVDKSGPSHPDAGMFLSDWALSLGMRFEEMGNHADLDQAIEAARSAVECTTDDHPGLADRLGSLGMLLRTRSAATGKREDLAEATQAYAGSWALSAAAQSSMALQRYGRTLEEWIARLEQDLDGASPNERAALLRRLGGATIDLHGIARDASVLDKAVGWYERAVDEARDDDKAESLTRLTLAVRTRALEAGSRADFDRAVDLARDVVRMDPDREGARNNLGLVLADRYRAFGAPADLTESLDHMRADANTVAADAPDAARVVSNLVVLLLEHAHQTDDPASVDEAIERGLAVTPQASGPWLTLAATTAEALLRRSAATGDAADLERALTLCWTATDRGRARSPGHAALFNALGGALRARYWRDGDVEDLEQALIAYRVAATSSPQAGFLGNLGSTLRAKYLITGARRDLDAMLAALEGSVERSATERSERALSLMNLGVGLLSRFDDAGDPDDLDRGIEHLRQAADHPDAPPAVRRVSRVNLAHALVRRAERAGDPMGLDDAVDLLRAESAKAELPPRGSVVLGKALRARYRRLGHPDDLTDGVRHLRDAARRGLDTDLEVSLAAASTLTDWALERQDWGQACEAAALATEASEQGVRVQVDAGNKEHWLRLTGDVPADGAYALARTGRLEEAILTIEQGRARLLADALELDRLDIERLPDLGHADLYRRFRYASQRLDVAVRAATVDPSLRDRAVKAESLRSTRKQFEKVVAEIHAVPGYDTLMQRMSVDDIAAASATAPMVYLLVTVAGGLALVVTPEPGGERGARIRPIWLEGIDRATLRHRLAGAGAGGEGDEWSYLTAQLRYGAAPRDAYARVTWLDALDRTTGWIWETVMGPLLQELTDLNVPLADGVVLVPAGLLGLLPLHAAWTPIDDGRRYVLDTVAVRYAPNARAVLVSQDRLTRLGPDRLLLAVDPQPITRAGPLPATPEEAARILLDWGKDDRTVLWHQDVTADAISTLLEDHTVFHFAGHAFADWSNPAQGGLLVAHDEVLTVEQLSRSRVALRLAVLSACETGMPGARVPNEVVGLPTALVQAGGCGVVASLWPVPDESTSRLMDHFYRRWREGGVAPAEALRHAQAAMRSDGTSHMHQWAAFGYTGV